MESDWSDAVGVGVDVGAVGSLRPRVQIALQQDKLETGVRRADERLRNRSTLFVQDKTG